MSDFRESFKSWQSQNTKNTLAFASRATGISRPVISDWAAGKYKGSNENVESKIKTFLTLQHNKRNAKSLPVKFTDTIVSLQIFDVLDQCNIDNDCAVITGSSGIGKTMALQEYARSNRNTIHIEANQSYSAFSLVKTIHKSLKAHTGREGLTDLVDDIIKTLKDSDRMIIIDEAEFLPVKALDIIRSICDNAHIGLALVGLPRLEANLRGRRGENEYLHNRVGIFVKLSPIIEDDATDIINMIIPNCSPNAVKLLFKKAPSARSMVKLAKRASRIAAINNCEINADVVDSAANHLML